MKNELFKKFNGSSDTNDRFKYLETKLYERSEYSSLNKYNRSPYLQKITNQLNTKKKNSSAQPDTKASDQVSLSSFKKRTDPDLIQPQFRSYSNNSNYQLPRVNNITISPNKKIATFKLPKIDQQDSPTLENAYDKYTFPNQRENLISALKKQTSQPEQDKMQQIILNVFTKTNQSLLDSQINTELSGSTVVAVFQYKNKLLCFNVGDSRAILCYQVQNDIDQSLPKEQQKPELQLINSKQKTFRPQKIGNTLMKINLSKSHRLDKYSWKVHPLSIDQKPQRQDEKQRVLRNGGRIECNKTQKGQEIGPLRVWMKDIQMPGLAMTRSFGDKAGLKAGTCGQAEVIEHEIRQEDKFIVIASDGVWQYLQNEEVMNAIVPFYMRDDIDMAAEKVVKLSTQIWGHVSLSRDDITIIIISLHPPKQ